MKKKFLVSTFLVLSILFFNTVFSVASQPMKCSVKTSISQYTPRWDEFCPPEYIDTNYKPKHGLPKLPDAPKDPGFWGYIFPYCINPKWNQYDKALKQHDKDIKQYCLDVDIYTAELEHARLVSYWSQRRKAFDSEIKLCLANKSTTSACFMQVRQLEEYKTALKNGQDLQKAQQTQQAAQFAAQQAAQDAQMLMQNINNSQMMMMQSINNAQSQFQAQQMNNNLNNINSSINNFNNNANTNSNTTNSNLHAINHNLNRINRALH